MTLNTSFIFIILTKTNSFLLLFFLCFFIISRLSRHIFMVSFHLQPLNRAVTTQDLQIFYWHYYHEHLSLLLLYSFLPSPSLITYFQKLNFTLRWWCSEMTVLYIKKINFHLDKNKRILNAQSFTSGDILWRQDDSR